MWAAQKGRRWQGREGEHWPGQESRPRWGAGVSKELSGQLLNPASRPPSSWPASCHRGGGAAHDAQALATAAKQAHLVPAPGVAEPSGVANDGVAGRRARCDEHHLDALQ